MLGDRTLNKRETFFFLSHLVFLYFFEIKHKKVYIWSSSCELITNSVYQHLILTFNFYSINQSIFILYLSSTEDTIHNFFRGYHQLIIILILIVIFIR